jgi:CheY-like chemotaxis protein
MECAPKRILIVEDESIVAMTEAFMLGKRGYSVDTASSGELAIRMLEEGTVPGLILMDIDLGRGIDGIAAGRAILERWDLPIVFLTSRSEKAIVEKARLVTRYGYIIKNSGDFVMLSTIEMAFELFEKERALRELAQLPSTSSSPGAV